MQNQGRTLVGAPPAFSWAKEAPFKFELIADVFEPITSPLNLC